MTKFRGEGVNSDQKSRLRSGRGKKYSRKIAALGDWLSRFPNSPPLEATTFIFEIRIVFSVENWVGVDVKPH